jgi:hypothetical protein
MNEPQAPDPGEAWRYAPHLAEPQAQRRLLQAALTACLTIRHARATVNPEDFATVPDWRRVEAELTAALQAVGHPAGGGGA